ncbi:MAG: lysyl oxidase family protein [Flavobacteriales bacterium]
MMDHYRSVVIALLIATAEAAHGQCSVSGITSPNAVNTSATTCVCEQAGQANCLLLPDITISWQALQSYSGGPNEYAQNDASNPGRLRVTGATPNIGHGPLNVRGVDKDGKRWFLCGTDTFSINDPNATTMFTCPNSAVAKQLILQRVYKKAGNAMQFTERFAGTMTYHPAHGHNHVDDWVVFTLRLQVPGENDPRNWPIVGTGAKIGFCLMDYYSCPSSSGNGHCRTDQAYGQGTALNTQGAFPNYGLGGQAYNCSQISQGISSGWEDVYSESLDGMWVNIPPGTCNGDYWIVMEVDPKNNFLEESDGNNWTAIPFKLTKQSPANSGAACSITADADPVLCSGQSITLTCANAGYSYQWSNGATTRSITVDQPGNYTVSVNNPCGTSTSAPFTVTVLDPQTPVTTGATINGSGQASLSATGSNLYWYDSADGGQQVGTGNSFVTPNITESTTYWCASRSMQPGVNANVGKATNAGTGVYSTADQYLIFDALKDMTIRSVKVYAQNAGTRVFQVLGDDGSYVAQASVYVPAGESRVTVDLNVPRGNNRRFYVTSTLRNLYRNSASVVFPYTIADVVSIKNSSSGTGYYYYAYDWQVTTPDHVCESARVPAVATVNHGVRVAAKAMLEGATTAGATLMRDDLRVAGLVPPSEPYTGLGFILVNGGGEATTADILAITGDSAVVDWVMLELRDAADPAVVRYTHAALLRRNGAITAATGGPVTFATALPGNYYVSVRHRNHLGCMTATAVALDPTAATLDLSDPDAATWGTEARKVADGKALLWCGNTNRDRALKYTGADNDRDPVLVQIGGVDPTAEWHGYHPTDVNMDGVVRYTGAGNDRDPILVNVGGVVPTNTRAEQLP